MSRPTSSHDTVTVGVGWPLPRHFLEAAPDVLTVEVHAKGNYRPVAATGIRPKRVLRFLFRPSVTTGTENVKIRKIYQNFSTLELIIRRSSPIYHS